jgi:hypothetical protein
VREPSLFQVLVADTSRSRRKPLRPHSPARSRARALQNRGRSGFLIGLKAGGFGLNLTEAYHGFLLDPWWNPATENQAIDRAHRIGQTPSGDGLPDDRPQHDRGEGRRARAPQGHPVQGVLDDGDAFANSVTGQDIRGLVE